ncbi:hypothetical protein GCM10008983_17340 [Lentibacillus halophilus]|uniref:5,10-methylene-tetrahydrofolate dehydrogenase n=1 Tax=Lentibacillus halophilus TaxID=295065 RepID=A0ABN0ZAF7_9BACI
MRQHVNIGLIAAPELADELAQDLVKTLPETLKTCISNDTEWDVEARVDSLTGAAESVVDIFSEAAAYRETKPWDYIISLTDLPVFHEKNVVAVDINEDKSVGLISIPAFGWMPVLKRIQTAVIQTVDQMLHTTESQGADSTSNGEKQDDIVSSERLWGQFPISPVQKVRTWMRETGNKHTRYIVTPRMNGSLRLLSGMTFANKPFKMMSSLTSVIAIAFTTGTFGMIFTTMWQLSHLFSTLRLTEITLVAIIGMMLWVIIAHGLWEPPSTFNHRRVRRLYNFTTVTTLLIAITVYYAVIFLLFFGTSLVFIPPGFLTETLSFETTAGVTEYLRIAWFASSISTVAGAIGAGLENEELVLSTTYGYRQNRRYQQIHYR